MVDLNATIPILEPVAGTFQGLFNILQILVGGIFGLYVIMLAVRIYYYVKFLKIFKNFKEELKKLSNKVNSMDRKLSSLKIKK